MRSLFIAVVIALATSNLLAAEPNAPPAKPSVSGLWLGVMQVGPIPLRMAIEINAAKDGTISGKVLSLDQNSAEVPCESFAFDSNELTIEMPAISARFAGELAADGNSISGKFIQLDNPIALNLKRIDKLPTLKRPQHPTKPYPYFEEDVSFANDAARIELAGTLTLPKGKGPFPAVVLATGSGAQDRDQTIFEHKPFLVIADHLTRQGIAVLRIDDRGVGKSGGSFAGSTTEDFASDAHAAILYLRGRKEIDSARIGVIGHSEGATTAQIVAAKHPDDVAFLVFLAGFGVSGEELAVAQSLDAVRAAGGSDADVKLSGDLMRALILIAKQSGPGQELNDKLMAATTRFIEKLEDAEAIAALKGSEEVVAARFNDPWVRFLVSYDTAATLGQVKCPVLALAGSHDVQVRSKVNLKAIDDALRAGGNHNSTTIEFENLNHLFQTCVTGEVSEYLSIEETFSPEALSAMSKWIRAQRDPNPPTP